MKPVMKALGATLLVALALTVALVIGVVSITGALDPDTLIEINGEPVALLGAAHWLAGGVGTLLALLIVLVVVPVAVLLPLLFVAAVVAGALLLALLAVTGVAALVFSPLILLAGGVWLIWRLLRGEAPKQRAAADATIAG
jgi:hypothetical protein